MDNLRYYRGFVTALFCLFSDIASAQHDTSKKARDLGISFEGTTVKNNAITDVSGIEIGYKTRIEDSGELVRGKGPVRTVVTVILPKRKDGSIIVVVAIDAPLLSGQLKLVAKRVTPWHCPDGYFFS